MNKISLYKTNICISRSIISYGKSKSIGVDRGAAPRTREWFSQRRETLFSYALSCSSSEGRWPFSCESRCADRDEFCVCERMGKTELRPIWEKRGLFIFFLPPYSPHLNIAETLWRILKGKWIRPQDYESTDMLFYTTNRALADIGKGLNIQYLKHAA